MTAHGLPVPLAAVIVFVVGLILFGTLMVVRQINAQSVRCNPQGACTDSIGQPYVMRRTS